MELVSFFEKTWLLWWIVAVICILTWFHRIESDAEERFKVSEGEEPKPETLPLGFRTKRAHLPS
jgi:hypothetical protein